MRHPLPTIACVLAVLTGTWFGQAYALFAPSGLIAAPDTNHAAAEAAVWRFYDAVDLVLRTGDDAALRQSVAPDFVDHSARPGLPPTRDGLLRYLASLRTTHPALRLVPQALVAQGDRVVAQLDLAGDDSGAVLGIPLAGTRPWSRIDVFRLDGDRIAEHWDDAHGLIVAAPLASASVMVPLGPDLIPSIERITYAPGATGRDVPRYGPSVILVETGAVAVTVAGAPAVLGPGDTVVVPAGAAAETSNRTEVAAVILVIAMNPPVWPDTPGAHKAASSPRPPGITARLLASGATGTTEPGPLTVAAGRVTLGPGAQLPSHHTTGTELLIVETGALTATLGGDAPRAWLLSSSGLGVTVAGGIEHVAPNTGLSVFPNAIATYRNDGATALSLLMVTIQPETVADYGAEQ